MLKKKTIFSLQKCQKMLKKNAKENFWSNFKVTYLRELPNDSFTRDLEKI